MNSRLSSKLSPYGVHNQTHHWITSWLTNRKQRVIVNGVASKWVPVKSSVPQGTVLGPLMFLICINDIGENVFSTLKLFADDCILYRTISTPIGCHKLQEDLNSVYQWSKLWQMNFNINKCVVLKCYKSVSPITTHYHLNNHILECVKEHSYLGVTLIKLCHSLHTLIILFPKPPKYSTLLSEISINAHHQSKQLLTLV